MFYPQIPLQCTQVSIGRFHHFHLARQLERYRLLRNIYTGYPLAKLKDEHGISPTKIKTYPWLHAPYMARGRLGLDRFQSLERAWAWHAQQTLDYHVASKLKEPHVLIALAGSGLYSGRQMKRLGGLHICDHGSAHIVSVDNLLASEYKRYGITSPRLDSRMIDKQCAEYDCADFITVPSQFCLESFKEQGVDCSKLVKIPYGFSSGRFYQESHLESRSDDFIILFVGRACAQKGFIDLVSAFEQFTHPKKKLVLIGTISHEAKLVLDRTRNQQIETIGVVSNAELRSYYNQASVFVLPSIQEGMAMVVCEAMACGCPVIASVNTGATEVIDDGKQGFIVPIHSPSTIAARLEALADQPHLLQSMRHECMITTSTAQGWDNYGSAWHAFISGLPSSF